MHRRIITAGAVTLVVGLIVLLITVRPGLQTPPAPLVLPVSVSRSNAAFSVFPGYGGAMFVLPDGSLWHWGVGAGDRDGLPKRADSGHGWVNAFKRSGGEWLALDSNGDIWDVPNAGPSRQVLLPGTNYNWTDLTGGVVYILGLQRDGTILGWEDGFGASRGAITLTAVQTNLLWRAVSAYGPACLGVSRDGKLWTWARMGFSPLTFSSPTQVTTNTHWIGVAEGQYAWSGSGELWGTPVAHLNNSNAIDGRFAVGSLVHEIRPDGTLWAIGAPEPSGTRPMARGGVSLSGLPRFLGGGAAGAGGSGGVAYSSSFNSTGPGLMASFRKLHWHRIGERADWVSVWGSDGTYFGLTSDGTVWIWGTDWGRKPIATLKDRLVRLWEQIRFHFQPTTGPAGAFPQQLMTLTQPYQEEPRPLMRFKPQETNK